MAFLADKKREGRVIVVAVDVVDVVAVVDNDDDSFVVVVVVVVVVLLLLLLVEFICCCCCCAVVVGGFSVLGFQNIIMVMVVYSCDAKHIHSSLTANHTKTSNFLKSAAFAGSACGLTLAASLGFKLLEEE